MKMRVVLAVVAGPLVFAGVAASAVSPTVGANGYSGVVTPTKPKPSTRYVAQVVSVRSLGIVYLILRATPLGEDRPYRVCWRLKNREHVCVRGTLDSSDGAGSDFLRVNTRGMGNYTTFAWQVGSRTVARKRVRTR